MKRRRGWLLLGLVTCLVSASCWGTECRFFRIGCLDGAAPENLAITLDESGEIFVEFDTEDQSTYVIEAADRLSESPPWATLSSITGDGQRARWLWVRQWSRTFGGSNPDAGRSVQQTSDGGYIVAGNTSSFGAGNDDAYLIKTDKNGNEVWSRTFGGSLGDQAWSVRQTFDGGYILAGTTYSFGPGGADVYLIKTDSDGNNVWSRTFGGTDYEEGQSVQQTSDEGYILAGCTRSFGAGGDDVYLIKTDSEGDEVWSRIFGRDLADAAYSVQQTSDGGYILAGTTYTSGAGEYDVCLIKTDQNGNEVWSRALGGADADQAYSVQQTSDDGYIVAGWTRSFGAGGDDVYLIRTDGNGSEIWSNWFGGTGKDRAECVRETSDGGYIVAGYTTDGLHTGAYEVYLIKTDAGGNEVWSRTFGRAAWDGAHSVQQTSDGGYIVAGYTGSFGPGLADVYLIKTDQYGNAPSPQ